MLPYSTFLVDSTSWGGGEGGGWSNFVPLLPIFVVFADSHSNFLRLDCLQQVQEKIAKQYFRSLGANLQNDVSCLRLIDHPLRLYFLLYCSTGRDNCQKFSSIGAQPWSVSCNVVFSDYNSNHLWLHCHQWVKTEKYSTLLPPWCPSLPSLST